MIRLTEKAAVSDSGTAVYMEKTMKLAVLYDSKSGNTKQAAEWIAEGMEQIEGTEARCFHIDEIDEAFAKEARGIVIGCPVYAASMTAAMRNWLQTSAGRLELAGKLGGAFATEQYTHGGAELDHAGDPDDRDGTRNALLFRRRILRKAGDPHRSGGGQRQCRAPQRHGTL